MSKQANLNELSVVYLSDRKAEKEAQSQCA